MQNIAKQFAASWLGMTPSISLYGILWIYINLRAGNGIGEGSEERSRYTETGLAVGYLRSWQLLRMSRNSVYHPLSTHHSKHPPSPPKIYHLLSSHLISSFFSHIGSEIKEEGIIYSSMSCMMVALLLYSDSNRNLSSVCSEMTVQWYRKVHYQSKALCMQVLLANSYIKWNV